MRKIVLGLVAAQVLTAGAAWARAADGTAADGAPAVHESVQVSGLRDPDFKPYRTMLLGVDAFEKHRGRAPSADLKFMLRPLVPGTDLAGVTLRVANDAHSLALPVAGDGTFVLVREPSVDTKDAELLTNRKKGSVRWRPHIMTPGLPKDTRRLGDLRAECEVYWAIGQDEMNFAKRALLAALGACTSKRSVVRYSVDKPLAGATLRDGSRTKEVAQPGQSHYVPPVNDESWSDDALIELRYGAPTA